MCPNTFKVTVEDGTNIEVKLDKANKTRIGIVHIFHGMAEHMGRYDTFVESLNQQGYDVIRHNHRGHGKDIDESTRGHYDSIENVAADAYEIAQTLYPERDELPYIVLGHSMGSIIARKYVEMYPDMSQGLILTGTGLFPKLKGKILALLMKIITIVFGKRRRLRWVNRLAFRPFNRGIQNVQTENDWLSTQREEVDRYCSDQYCGFLVSNQIIYETLNEMMKTSTPKEIKKMNADLPVLLISGKDDAFGDYGKGIRRLGVAMKKNGVKHITVQLYRNKRHEILFEEDYHQTWNNMYDWIKKNILNKYKQGD
ncbi:lysophospholipase [Staphylococcus simulans]|uniref:Lysophospholipase n=1 Tax=Staphylococcus simulans UMC-CNS-990 TaxID=1405498 RepID=A0ABN0PC40_STASI|nr:MULTISPECIES: alpha/beta hydrolase [Staphylococcus]ERS93146.1 lysophospholipase [Staphylococcus simulans UMC-CNS-990]KXA47474.1 hydrolase, alpha/beta hydrolase fold family protein [Staphylococcus simulans]MBO0387589.1 lysophospholipase [Staphylococcus simulans]MCE5149218.1 lysophospholipase [Staphylococcus simulans]MDN6205543.1 lysophospholipase [Staphylococcus simulans]